MNYLNVDGTINEAMTRAMRPLSEDLNGYLYEIYITRRVADEVEAFLALHGMTTLFTIVDTCDMECNYDGYLAMSEKLVEHERKGFAIDGTTLWVVIYHLDPDYTVVQFQWDVDICAGEPSYMSPIQRDCQLIKAAYNV